MSYEEFLKAKSQYGKDSGFTPLWIPDFLFDFQKHLVDWAIRKGRSAILADCGLGKSVIELVWAQNIVEKENKAVLLIAPLAVSYQLLAEAEKFGIDDVGRSINGKVFKKITITNYERLHYFNSKDFIGVICDESGILKNVDGKTKGLVTEFLRERPYRLLCTATPAPNDYVELGTASEALGEMGYMDMLGRFFRNVNNSTMGSSHGFKHRERLDAFRGAKSFWRFKKHAEKVFWQWVCSWARAMRKPSDLGFDDTKFILPPLIEKQTVIENSKLLPGELFHKIAIGLREQREEMRLTLKERCDKVAELAAHHDISVTWCHLNDEGDLLEEIIPDSVQIKGSDSDESKEQNLLAFANGQIKTLITKSTIAGYGMNWQKCAHMTFFPSHSFEQYYQSVRRCWRFGQKRSPTIDIITTPGGLDVLKNLQRKSLAAERMFDELIKYMTDSHNIESVQYDDSDREVPLWL